MGFEFEEDKNKNGYKKDLNFISNYMETVEPQMDIVYNYKKIRFFELEENLTHKQM